MRLQTRSRPGGSLEGREMKRVAVSLVAIAALAALAGAGASFGGVARHASAARVTVTFTDSKLGVSSTTLDAGTTTFVVVNKGKKSHVVSISGPGGKGLQTATLAAGHSTRLTVKLRKGSYMLSDPIGLGAYQVQYLSIIPAATLAGTGSTNTPAKPTTPYNRVCAA